MSAVGEPARERPALRVALVAGDPIRHQGLMAIIRGGGHAVVEHHGEADVVLVDGESIDQYGPPAVTLGGTDSGQAGALPADATAVQIDAALLAAAAGLIVRVPGLSSPSFEALDDGEAPLLRPAKPRCWPQSPMDSATRPRRAGSASPSTPSNSTSSRCFASLAPSAAPTPCARDCGNDCLKSEPQTQ